MKKHRNEHYWKLREAGFTASQATKLKDQSMENIVRAIEKKKQEQERFRIIWEEVSRRFKDEIL